MAEVWTVKRCMDWTRAYLEEKGAERGRHEAVWMLSAVTGLSRMELFLSLDRPLSKAELDRMHGYVVRRAKGEPLQYILGDTQFRTITVLCEPGVLIPRPETELLVEEVLNFLDKEVLLASDARRARVELPWNAEVAAARSAEEARAREAAAAGGGSGEASADAPAELLDVTEEGERAEIAPGDGTPEAEGVVQAPEGSTVPARTGRSARVLEIGSGTGCISLSIVSERPGLVTAVATDIDPHAVALSVKNREALGIEPARADFREGSLTAPISHEERGSFDVLVSNPPYIPESVMPILPREVTAYEPHRALASGADGLDLFRHIVKAAPHMLRPGGLLACELFEDALSTAADICTLAGFADVHVTEDLTGRPRFVLARWR
ncbi:N5-glutamine methyltransferase family protein [Collinsella vaginalis]|uniref:N5-glutamine methyltransferase family protein n=1 Tax=Collinsella vaginalis TaxID=1870987 RepID=UPI000A26879B|nr:HemK/PrmC family methyltransferase [Collinsella vaginalis]